MGQIRYHGISHGTRLFPWDPMGSHLSRRKSRVISTVHDTIRHIPWMPMRRPMGIPMGAYGPSHGTSHGRFHALSRGSDGNSHRIFLDPMENPLGTAICPMKSPMGCPIGTHGMYDAPHGKSRLGHLQATSKLRWVGGSSFPAPSRRRATQDLGSNARGGGGGA